MNNFKFQILKRLHVFTWRVTMAIKDWGFGNSKLCGRLWSLNRTINRRMESEPVSHWFELSYAQYLTIPRSVLQAMPHDWQCRFVACLNELDDSYDWRPKNAQYFVTLVPFESDIELPDCGDPLQFYRDWETRKLVEGLKKEVQA